MEKEAPHLADLLTFMDFSAEQVLRWKLDGDATDSGIHDLHGKTRDTRPADDRHGREGKALQFVGTRTSVSHPDHPLLDLGSRWSILLWIKPEEPVAEAGLVQKWGPTKPERNGYALCFGSNAKTVKIYANAEYPRRYQQASARTDLSGKWHFVAATYDGQLLSIFLNGKLESSTAVPLPPPANGHPLRVGSDPYSSSRNFRGAMDDLIIYRRSLSPFEIAQAHGIMEEGDLPEGS
jgi:hypothetical protein